MGDIMDDIYISKFEKVKSKKQTSFISKLFSKVLICIIIFLSSMIFINSSEKNKELFKKYVFDTNFNFSKITNLYNKYFGKIVPLKEVPEDKLVFNEDLFYKNIDTDNYIWNGYICMYIYIYYGLHFCFPTMKMIIWS